MAAVLYFVDTKGFLRVPFFGILWDRSVRSIDGTQLDGCPRGRFLAWELVANYRQKIETNVAGLVVESLCRCQTRDQTDCLSNRKVRTKRRYGDFANLSGVRERKVVVESLLRSALRRAASSTATTQATLSRLWLACLIAAIAEGFHFWQHYQQRIWRQHSLIHRKSLSCITSVLCVLKFVYLLRPTLYRRVGCLLPHGFIYHRRSSLFYISSAITFRIITILSIQHNSVLTL